MKKLLLTLFFALPLAAQVSNPGVTYTNTTPSGSCRTKALPVRVSTTGALCTCPAGTYVCTSTGSGTGTVTTSGSPVSGNIAAFSSATAITAATAAQIVAAISTTAVANATAAVTAANLSGTPTLPTGTAAATGSPGAGGTNVATQAYVAAPGAIAPTSVTPSGPVYTAAEYSNGTCTTSKTITPVNGNRQSLTLADTDPCVLTFTQPTGTS